MAATHILKLESIQYRCLRIALGLMQSTHVQTLEIIGGMPPLRLKFSMLDHKYFILAFLTGRHPLRRLLAVLSRLNFTKTVREFDMDGDYNSEPVRLVYDYPLEALLHVPNVNDVVERELTSVGRDFYQMMVAWEIGRRWDLQLHRYFSVMVQRAGWVLVLVYIIKMVLSAYFGDVGDFCVFNSDKGTQS
jgi:hypothetical protein